MEVCIITVSVLRMYVPRSSPAGSECGSRAAEEEREADQDHQRPGNDAEPVEEDLGQDVAGQLNCNSSEREDPQGMDQRHRQP